MMLTSRAAVRSLAALATLGAVALGCSRGAPPAHPSTTTAARVPPRTPVFESSVPAVEAQRRAQRVWCTYLDALYHRATRDGTKWSQLERCNIETSTASPELLERTAACSQQALDGFDGDPFTPEYAAEVKRCGATVLEAMALTTEDLEPIVSLACQQAPACGQGEVDGCRSDVTTRLGKRLGRAVGALNGESRIALRRCLRATACQSVDDRIASCLEPMLDRLLWTPD
jgi:hypothetical protein